jgi:hypothetical protein
LSCSASPNVFNHNTNVSKEGYYEVTAVVKLLMLAFWVLTPCGLLGFPRGSLLGSTRIATMGSRAEPAITFTCGRILSLIYCIWPLLANSYFLPTPMLLGFPTATDSFHFFIPPSGHGRGDSPSMLCLRSEDAFVITCVANLMEVNVLYVQQDLRYEISNYWRFNV